MARKSAKDWKRANGKGTITKLSGNRRKPWIARGSAIDSDGFATRPYIGTFATKEEAILALAEWEKNVGKISNGITFEEVFEKLIPEKIKEGVSESTIEGDRASFKSLSAVHKLPIDELQTGDYQEIFDNLISKDSASKSKLTKMRSLISQMYDFLNARGFNLENYAKYISLRGVTQKKIRAYTTEEVNAIEKLVHDEDIGKIARASMILAYTGLRINEFLSLKKFQDISIAENVIRTKGSKTVAGRNRVIPIHERILPHVLYFLRDHPESEYLFSRDGTKVSDNYYRKNYHSKLIEKIQCEDRLTPHSFRHTASSLFRMAGLSDRVIMEILGHESIKTTDDTYVDLTAEYLNEQIKRIG